MRGATLVGLRADTASCPENWESDFDFDSSTSILPSTSGCRNVGNESSSQLGSSPRASISAAERSELEELLKALPTFTAQSDQEDDDIPTNIGPSRSAFFTQKLGIKDLVRDMQFNAHFDYFAENTGCMTGCAAARVPQSVSCNTKSTGKKHVQVW